VIRDGRGIEEASVGLYWKYEKWIRKQQSRLDSVMGATGCIYAMRATWHLPCPEDTLNDDMFCPLGAFFRGFRVILDDAALAYDYPTPLGQRVPPVRSATLAGVYQIVAPTPLCWAQEPYVDPLFLAQTRPSSHALALMVALRRLPLLAGALERLGHRRAAAAYLLAVLDPWLPAGFPQALDLTHAHVAVVMTGVAVRSWILFVPPARAHG